VTLIDSSQQGGENLREKYQLAGPILMYVGNLEKYQGIDLLLDGFSRVAGLVPDIHLLLIGGSEDDIAHYDSLVLEMNLDGKVILCGPRPIKLLGYYLDQADILVSPRIQGNNTPMKIYSYLDTGKPVLATRLGTHTQVLDDDIACLVAPEAESMGDGILRLLNDPELCRRLGRNGRDRVALDFSPAAYRKKLAQFYKTVMGKIADLKGQA
jgi:glycosyltransferase involved in cell wall biosynthesis